MKEDKICPNGYSGENENAKHWPMVNGLIESHRVCAMDRKSKLKVRQTLIYTTGDNCQ